MSPYTFALDAPSLGPAASFGLRELVGTLTRHGGRQAEDAPLRLHIGGDPGAPPESYRVAWRGEVLELAGADDYGQMLACLEVAEQLDLGADLPGVAPHHAQPELAVRGVYTFLHNAEAERAWLYDPAYWQAYADALARCRFNRFNLIYGHQTAHLIPIYAHLLGGLEDAFPGVQVDGLTDDERQRNLAALQTASQAMSARGLHFCLGIWQSRPWKIEHGVWETQPTRVSGVDDLALLAEYTRMGFARLMEACPAISGIQLRMNIESGVGDQRFFVAAFAPALRDLAARGRRLAVELRNWGLHPETLAAFRATGLEVVVSTKYFAEHQALPYQPPVMRGSYSYDSFLRRDRGVPFQWHLWNLGSHRLFAWGDPDYARRFALSCHLGAGVGFEVTPPGSQKGFSQWGQVQPGDWATRSDAAERPDFERYWLFLSAFGRMGYDPATSAAVFQQQLAQRVGAQAAPALLEAYRAASQVVSLLISQRMDDPNMYVWPELDAGGPIDHHLIAPPGEETLFSTAQQAAEDALAGQLSAKVSPVDFARRLEAIAAEVEAALNRVASCPDLEGNVEWRSVRVDFWALACLARYHATKARASEHLALFYACGERAQLDAAEVEATEAVRRWQALEAATEVYYPALHLGPSGGHWHDNCRRVGYDLKRVARVRELFAAQGLFAAGFDFGPREELLAPRFRSGLEWEPRYTPVGPLDAYSPERGWGWLRTAGIRAAGAAPLPRERIWGVHYVKPGAPPDPTEADMLPADALTQRYLTGDERCIWRVDLPNGEYSLTLISPEAVGLVTPVVANGQTAMLGVGGPGLGAPATPGMGPAELRVAVTEGKLELALGGAGPWALAGLAVRALAPQIAHLPPRVALAGQNLRLTATATSPNGPCTLTLRVHESDAWHEYPLLGDGVAFAGNLPQVVEPAGGSFVEYSLVARDAAGAESRLEGLRLALLEAGPAPTISGVRGPDTWRPGEPLLVAGTLSGGARCAGVRLHYREADQNRPFRVAELPGGRDGRYRWAVDTRLLDPAYDLIYYLEVLDMRGGGSFWPDPFTDARYRICRGSHPVGTPEP